VSVVSLAGLPGLESQRRFLNQLSMTLFAWIKKNPDPGGRPLRGLLVIDEAKDFVPSGRASTCRESLLRLGAQARKYHLGLVFATQNPKDIDPKLVGNCSTHVYGKMNSPVAIEAVRDLIRQKGGQGDDVAKLGAGRFYVHNADAGLPAPLRIQAPYSLSRHPANPLDDAVIVAKAKASRSR
jgi:DNA helicase HerA-like ATPase